MAQDGRAQPFLFSCALRGGNEYEVFVMSYSFCKAKAISRTASGGSAVAAAAYRAGEELRDEEHGKTWKYKKDEVTYSKITLPDNAPPEFADRATLWNSVQKAEKNSDSRLARELVIGFPNELSQEQAQKIMDDFAKYLAKKGMCVDVAIHWKDGNHHAHMMLTTRKLDKNGRWAKWKERKVLAKDEKGNKIPLLDENGNQLVRVREGHGVEKLWKRVSVLSDEWSKKSEYKSWKKELAGMMNRELEKSGVYDEVDYRSYKEQGSDLIPQIHEGYAAREIEKRGGVSWKCEKNREIRAINKSYLDKKEAIEKELNEVNNAIYDKAATVEIVPYGQLKPHEMKAVSQEWKLENRKEWSEEEAMKIRKESVFVRENGGGVHLLPFNKETAHSISPILGKKTPNQIKNFLSKLRKSGYDNNACNRAAKTIGIAQAGGIAKVAKRAAKAAGGAKEAGAAATLKGARQAMAGALDTKKDAKSHAIDVVQNVGEICKTPFAIAKDLLTNPVTGIFKSIVCAFKAVDSALSAVVNVGAATIKHNQDKDYGIGSGAGARVRKKEDDNHNAGPSI